MTSTSRRRRREQHPTLVDPDLIARRRDAARTLFGCEHPDRHHYMTQADAEDGLRRMVARTPDLRPATRTVRPCCQVGFVWLTTE